MNPAQHDSTAGSLHDVELAACARGQACCSSETAGVFNTACRPVSRGAFGSGTRAAGECSRALPQRRRLAPVLGEGHRSRQRQRRPSQTNPAPADRGSRMRPAALEPALRRDDLPDARHVDRLSARLRSSSPQSARVRKTDAAKRQARPVAVTAAGARLVQSEFETDGVHDDHDHDWR